MFHRQIKVVYERKQDEFMDKEKKINKANITESFLRLFLELCTQ